MLVSPTNGVQGFYIYTPVSQLEYLLFVCSVSNTDPLIRNTLVPVSLLYSK